MTPHLMRIWLNSTIRIKLVDIGKADFSKAKIRKSKRRSKSKTRQAFTMASQITRETITKKYE
jgi:hypothetical protein